jgi:hypothetical protein
VKVVKREKLILGWREWAALPQLKIEKIKVKVDTGARTSALHAFNIRPLKRGGKDFVQFEVHPIQRNEKLLRKCVCPIRDYRWVTDSGGKREKRFVIETPISIGGEEWPIEVTLTGRDQMRFRMLLGRHAVKNRFYVDPALSFRMKKNEKARKATILASRSKKHKPEDEEE